MTEYYTNVTFTLDFCNVIVTVYTGGVPVTDEDDLIRTALDLARADGIDIEAPNYIEVEGI